MPGKPAARMGDMANDCADPVDTPTGTVIAKGNVFINKMMAAKQGDQIMGADVHIVMVPSPTGPIPTPTPHPFSGLINGGTEPTVKIMGMPAAVVGSTATNMPPHIPQGGMFQIPPKNQATIIMGSPNVFIGSGGGGGGGGGSGSVSGGPDGIFNRSHETSDVTPKELEGHFLDATYESKDGCPIINSRYHLDDTMDRITDSSLSGPVRQYGIDPGEADIALRDIIYLGWNVEGKLKSGEPVKLQLETVGIKDGVRVVFKIFERLTDREDRLMARIDTEKIQGNKAEADWTLVGDKYPGDGVIPAEAAGVITYAIPDYYFTASVDEIEKRSSILEGKSDIEFTLKCQHGEAFGKLDYVAILPNGKIKKGQLNGDGYLKLTDLPARNVKIEFPKIAKRIKECAEGIHRNSDASDSLAFNSGTLESRTSGREDTATGSEDELNPKAKDLEWGKPKVTWDEEVDMTATVSNVPDGASVTLTIYEYDQNSAHTKVKDISATVSGGAVKHTWAFKHEDDNIVVPTEAQQKEHGPLQYFFTVNVSGEEFGLAQESKLLELDLGDTKTAEVLEFEDVLFHSDSAALMPAGRPNPENSKQNNIVGLDVLVTIYRYLNHDTYKDKNLLITGHTDSTADNQHNITLSEARAASIDHLLVADGEESRRAWVNTVESRKDIQRKSYRNEDLRRVLKWVDEISPNHSTSGTSWGCDPGKVDGSAPDDAMRNAIESFRAGYNANFSGSYENAQYGARYWGWAKQGEDPGWGAVYDIYQAELKRRLDELELDIEESRSAAKNALEWRDEPAVIGCGEERPIDKCDEDDTASGRRCQSNRRVEIMFLDPEDASELSSIPCYDPNRYQSICGSDECPLWGKEKDVRRFKMVYLAPEPPPPTPSPGHDIFGFVWVALYTPLYNPLAKISCRLESSSFSCSPQNASDQGEVSFIDVPLTPPFTIVLELGNNKLEIDVPWLREQNIAHDIVVIECDKLLGPKDDSFGIQARLSGLGYDCGALDGSMGQKTTAALTKFQSDQGLEISGNADPVTQDVLKSMFGA